MSRVENTLQRRSMSCENVVCVCVDSVRMSRSLQDPKMWRWSDWSDGCVRLRRWEMSSRVWSQEVGGRSMERRRSEDRSSASRFMFEEAWRCYKTLVNERTTQWSLYNSASMLFTWDTHLSNVGTRNCAQWYSESWVDSDESWSLPSRILCLIRTTFPMTVPE